MDRSDSGSGPCSTAENSKYNGWIQDPKPSTSLLLRPPPLPSTRQLSSLPITSAMLATASRRTASEALRRAPRVLGAGAGVKPAVTALVAPVGARGLSTSPALRAAYNYVWRVSREAFSIAGVAAQLASFGSLLPSDRGLVGPLSPAPVDFASMFDDPGGTCLVLREVCFHFLGWIRSACLARVQLSYRPRCQRVL